MIENPDVKQEVIHCLRGFAKCVLANLCARQFLHLSYLQGVESGSGDKPTFCRLIAPISEGVSDMIHTKGDSGCVRGTLHVLSSD